MICTAPSTFALLLSCLTSLASFLPACQPACLPVRAPACTTFALFLLLDPPCQACLVPVGQCAELARGCHPFSSQPMVQAGLDLSSLPIATRAWEGLPPQGVVALDSSSPARCSSSQERLAT